MSDNIVYEDLELTINDEDIVVFEYQYDYNNGSCLGKLVNGVKGFRNHYASTLMFRLVEMGFVEDYREIFTESFMAKRFYRDTEKVEKIRTIIRCYWVKK